MAFQLSGSGPEIYERVLVPLWFGRGPTPFSMCCRSAPARRCSTSPVEPGSRHAGRRGEGRTRGTGRRSSTSTPPCLRVARGAGGRAGYPLVRLRRHRYPLAARSLRRGPCHSTGITTSRTSLQHFVRSGVCWHLEGRIAFSIWDGHSPYTDAVCAAVAQHISPDVAMKQRAQKRGRLLPKLWWLRSGTRGFSRSLSSARS